MDVAKTWTWVKPKSFADSDRVVEREDNVKLRCCKWLESKSSYCDNSKVFPKHKAPTGFTCWRHELGEGFYTEPYCTVCGESGFIETCDGNYCPVCHNTFYAYECRPW